MNRVGCVVAVVLLGACSTVPAVSGGFTPEACQAKRVSFQREAERFASCQTDDDCEQVRYQTSGRCDVYALKSRPRELDEAVSAACDPVPQLALSCENFTGACQNQRCTAGTLEKPLTQGQFRFVGAKEDSVITRPVPDKWCISRALAPMARAYTGTMIIKSTVSPSGSINYFKVVKGPDAWTSEILWKLAQCRAEPAKLDGKPISLDYVVNLNFR